MPASKKNYKERALNLRRLGLLPKGYSSRSLTESQKRGIRKIESRLRRTEPTLDVLRNPGKYLFSKVSKSDADKLKDKYTVVRTRRGYQFFSYADHADNVRYDPKTETVIHRYKNREVFSYPYDTGSDTWDRVESFFKHKRKNKFLTFQVGDAPHMRIAISNLKDFQKYVSKLEEEWKARAIHPDEKLRRDNPFSQLQIVEVKNVKPPKSDSRKANRGTPKNHARKAKRL